MLPPLSALRARVYSASASVTFHWILGAFLGIGTMSFHAVAGEDLLIGNVVGDQDFPSISVGRSGGYAAFEDNRFGDDRAISAIALDANLKAQGELLRVNKLSVGKLEKPQVVGLNGGKTLFTWEVRQGKNAGIYFREMGTNGQFTAGEEMLNVPSSRETIKRTEKWAAHYRGKWKTRTHKFNDKIFNVREQVGTVAIAPLPSGGAVVVYQAIRRSETNSWTLEDRVYVSRGKFMTNAVLRPIRMTGDWMNDVYMQRIDADGKKVGEEIQVNQYTLFNQRTPSVSVLANGNLLVVWVSEFPVSSDWRANFRVDVAGRVFNGGGQPLTDEFVVAGSDGVAQANPATAAMPGGGFLVLWSQQEGTAGHGWDIKARTFGSDYTAAGAAFRVNDYATGDQFAPRVVSQGGEQLVVWTSNGQDGSREGVYGRVLHAGALGDGEFRINDTTASRQIHPAVAADGGGRALILWSGYAGATGLDLFSLSMPLGGSETGTE